MHPQHIELQVEEYHQDLHNAALESCEENAPPFVWVLREILDSYDAFSPIENVFDPLSAIADVAHDRMEPEEFFFMLSEGVALWPSAVAIDAIIAATENKVLTPCPGASPAVLNQTAFVAETSEQHSTLCPFCGADHADEVSA